MIDHPKFRQLKDRIRELDSLLVAYSGGTDSTFLLAVSKEVLGDRMMAVTIKTPYIADWEIDDARNLCSDLDVPHEILEFPMPDSIKNNPKERCYLCKYQLFSNLRNMASQYGYDHVADGTNADDTGSHRLGLKDLRELDIVSPLKDAGFTKDLIRTFSKEMVLPTWDKPAYACLLTRIPYGTEITQEELSRVEASETFLIGLGFRAVRVRSHGPVARIEIPREQIAELVKQNQNHHIEKTIKSFGYQFVTIDLEGYRTGSFDGRSNN